MAFVFAACVLLLPVPDAAAQMVREHDAAGLRGFHGGASTIRRSFQSDNAAQKVLKRILGAAGLAGLEDRIVLRASAETPDAAAFIDNGERIIFYNAEFMQSLAGQSVNNWPMIAVLAHEIGHHIRFHTEVAGRAHEFELEADYQAGFILRRMGANLTEAQSAFRTIGADAGTVSHPPRAQRLQAVTLGWTDGEPQAAPKVAATETAAATPRAGDPAERPSAGPVKRIVLRGDFGAGVVLADVVRDASGQWTWVENNVTFKFRLVSEHGNAVVLYDPSRDMYHHLNLKSRETYWRLGTSQTWNRHMSIVALD
ncbi:MAG: M48 family metalloprotease [Hyphomicrobium sp.]